MLEMLLKPLLMFWTEMVGSLDELFWGGRDDQCWEPTLDETKEKPGGGGRFFHLRNEGQLRGILIAINKSYLGASRVAYSRVLDILSR